VPAVDLRARELWPIVALAVGTVLFGLLPQLLVGVLDPAIDAVLAPFEAARAR
jgi:NADH-quinone oxidoreductase subunit M